MKSSRISLLALFVSCFSILVRVPFFHVPFLSDEGGAAYVAYFWSKGYSIYGNDVWFSRPQLFPLIYRLIFAMGGGGELSVRLFTAIYNSISVFFVFLIGKKWMSPGWALLAAFLFGLYSALPQVWGFSGDSGVFMILPGLVAVYLYLYYLERRLWSILIWAGIFVGIAILTKPTQIVLWVLMVIHMFLEKKDPHGFRRDSWIRETVGVSLGILVPLAIALVHGTFMAGFKDYLWGAYFFRLTSNSFLTIDLKEHLRLFQGTMWRVGEVFWIPFLLLFFLPRNHFAFRFIFLWLLFCGFGVFLGGNWYVHYFLICLPPLSLGSALVLKDLLDRQGGERMLLCCVAVLSLSMPVAVGGNYFLIASPEAKSQALLGGWRGDISSKKIGDYVRKRTTPDDRIYVLFAHPQVYYYASRLSVTRYLYYKDLYRVPGAFEEVIEKMQKPSERPVYVVCMTEPAPDERYARFRQVLNEHYHYETEIDNFPIYHANHPNS